MSAELEDAPAQTAASLVSGIVGDLQLLVEQQFQLTRREIEEEVRQRAMAAGIFTLGAACLLLGGFALCLAAVHGLHSAASPPGVDAAWLPLWACHAVVAAMLVVVGGSLALVGRARFKSVAAFRNPVTEIFQE